MHLTRWEPMSDLLDFHKAINNRSDRRPLPRAPGMALDVIETDEALVFTAAVPGADKESFDISYHDDVLTLKARLGAEEEIEGARYHLAERYHGEISRSLRLPFPVDVDRAQAKYDQGVLRLTLPKSESLKPKVIKVQ